MHFLRLASALCFTFNLNLFQIRKNGDDYLCRENNKKCEYLVHEARLHYMDKFDDANCRMELSGCSIQLKHLVNVNCAQCNKHCMSYSNRVFSKLPATLCRNKCCCVLATDKHLSAMELPK